MTETNINTDISMSSIDNIQNTINLITQIDYKTIMHFVLDLAIIFLICSLLFKVINKLANKSTKFLQKKNADLLLVRFMPLITKFLKSFVVIVATILWAGSLGFNVSAVLAGIGIGGLAVGFAIKELIADVFGTIVLIADKTAKIGDVIEVDKAIGDAALIGTVEDINFRSTKIRAFDGPISSIPNHILATSLIKNYTLANKRRIAEYIDIVYETPIEKVRDAIEICRNILKENTMIHEDFLVELDSLSASALKIYIKADTKTTNATEIAQIKAQILLNIFDKFNAAKIEFAYNTQTLYVKKEQ